MGVELLDSTAASCPPSEGGKRPQGHIYTLWEFAPQRRQFVCLSAAIEDFTFKLQTQVGIGVYGGSVERRVCRAVLK